MSQGRNRTRRVGSSTIKAVDPRSQPSVPAAEGFVMPKDALDKLADEITALGGILRCEQCGYIEGLASPRRFVAQGWPKHCDYTMRWWTQRQINAGEINR